MVSRALERLEKVVNYDLPDSFYKNKSPENLIRGELRGVHDGGFSKELTIGLAGFFYRHVSDVGVNEAISIARDYLEGESEKRFGVELRVIPHLGQHMENSVYLKSDLGRIDKQIERVREKIREFKESGSTDLDDWRRLSFEKGRLRGILSMFKSGDYAYLKQFRVRRNEEYDRVISEDAFARAFDGEIIDEMIYLSGVAERDYSEDLVLIKKELKDLKKAFHGARTERKEGDYSDVLIGVAEGFKAMGEGMKALEGLREDVRKGLGDGFEKLRRVISEIRVNVSRQEVHQKGTSGEGVPVEEESEDVELMERKFSKRKARKKRAGGARGIKF